MIFFVCLFYIFIFRFCLRLEGYIMVQKDFHDLFFATKPSVLFSKREWMMSKTADSYSSNKSRISNPINQVLLLLFQLLFGETVEGLKGIETSPYEGFAEIEQKSCNFITVSASFLRKRYWVCAAYLQCCTEMIRWHWNPKYLCPQYKRKNS